MDADGNDEEGFLRKLVNLYNLQKAVDEIVKGTAASGALFVLTDGLVKELHKVCMGGLLAEAGHYRTVNVTLSNSPHVPPEWIEVEAHMRSFYEYMRTKWHERDLVHLSAFCLWRINWVHPFRNGNGRTARAVSYLVLCAKHGKLLPAKFTVAEQITSNKGMYNNALRQADTIYLASGNLDLAVKPVEDMVAHFLKEQLKANFA